VPPQGAVLAMRKQQLLTHQRLTQLLDYCPDTGIFCWKVSRSNVHAGDRAGRAIKGYREIRIDGVAYYEHRLAWFYVRHEWPISYLDHINLDKADNRLSNLREATKSQNNFNTKCRVKNRVGMKGVSWNTKRRKWRATIAADRHRHCLGFFDSPEEARAAYAKAAVLLHGVFANTEHGK
jgi:hypothetical protein